MMKATKIDYQVLRNFELEIHGNLQTTEENLQQHCPEKEAECFKLVLEEDDIERVFLCITDDFANYTKNTFQLKETCEAAQNDSTVSCLLKKNIDLTKSDNWAPVFISVSPENGSLVAFDGNHRLLAHFLAHGNIDGLNAFLYVHENATSWPWFPSNAK